MVQRAAVDWAKNPDLLQLGVGFTRGTSLILLGFKLRARGCCAECFGINQQSHGDVCGAIP